MTLQYIASIIESNYYNGRVLDNDLKMDWDDFFQMARAANGEVMRMMWYDENQRGNANLYFAGSVSTERFPIKRKGRYRQVALGDGGAVKLPYAMGILRVAPSVQHLDKNGGPVAEEDDCEDYGNSEVFSRGEAGMEYSFGSDAMMEDLGEAFFVPVGNTLRLFGFPEATYAELDYLKNDEDLDIPEAIAWQIILAVLGPVEKVDLNPVDVTEDTNPNVVTVKKRIADPQGLDEQQNTSTR